MKNIIQQLNYAERFGVLQDLKEKSQVYRSFNKRINYLKIVLLLVISLFNIYFLKNLDFLLQLVMMSLMYSLVDYLINRCVLAPKANKELNKLIERGKRNEEGIKTATSAE